ncbi:MAG: hypothetical protein ACQCN6_06525 [Candidatus Bathyarchaeia archaeon]|jgi:hypothetical protein
MNASPMEGVKTMGAYNVFGDWDMAVVRNRQHDNAVHFVGEKICSIEA